MRKTVSGSVLAAGVLVVSLLVPGGAVHAEDLLGFDSESGGLGVTLEKGEVQPSDAGAALPGQSAASPNSGDVLPNGARAEDGGAQNQGEEEGSAEKAPDLADSEGAAQPAAPSQQVPSSAPPAPEEPAGQESETGASEGAPETTSERGLYNDGRGLRFGADDGTVVRNGWRTVSGHTYYFGSDGYAVRYRQTINGKRYYFNSKGQMRTGWVVWQDGSGRSYYGSDGAALSGWQTVGGKRYYLSPSDVDHRAVRYRQTVDGKRYYFNSQGQMFVGLLTWQDGSGRSYYGPDGVVVTGWRTVSGSRYYFDPKSVDGKSLRYRQTVDGKRYYFNSKGQMRTGWLKWDADGKWSYFGSDGVMWTGTRTIDGVTYTFDKDGKVSR